MPESPDFDQMARELIASGIIVDDGRGLVGTILNDTWKDYFADTIAEHLRLTWNARGAADTATIENSFPGTYTKTLDHMLRTLDR